MMIGLLGSRVVDTLLIVVPTLVRMTQALIVLAAVAAWVRPEVVPRLRRQEHRASAARCG